VKLVVSMLLVRSGSILVPGIVTDAELLTRAEDEDRMETVSVIVAAVLTGRFKTWLMLTVPEGVTHNEGDGLQVQGVPVYRKVGCQLSTTLRLRMSLGPVLVILMEKVNRAPATALAIGVMVSF